MSIKAYLFTNMARQINHTYYSLEYNKSLYFYHNLNDYHKEVNKILSNPFVLYHGVEDCLDLIIDKESKKSDLLYALFYCGYKFKNFDYSNFPWNREVAEAKTIFQNGFKYIE